MSTPSGREKHQVKVQAENILIVINYYNFSSDPLMKDKISNNANVVIKLVSQTRFS